MNAIRQRFDACAHPARLKLVQGVLVGDGKGRGQGQLAVEGLITSMVYAWCGLSPEFMKLMRAGKLEAWNLPFGVGAPPLIHPIIFASIHKAGSSVSFLQAAIPTGCQEWGCLEFARAAVLGEPVGSPFIVVVWYVGRINSDSPRTLCTTRSTVYLAAEESHMFSQPLQI